MLKKPLSVTLIFSNLLVSSLLQNVKEPVLNKYNFGNMHHLFHAFPKSNHFIIECKYFGMCIQCTVFYNV